MIQKGRQTGIYFTSLPTFLCRIRKAFKECLMFAPDKSRQDKQRNQNQKQFHFFIFFLMGLCVGLRTSRKFAGSNEERCLANHHCFRCAHRFCYSNPRSPRGERQGAGRRGRAAHEFQSTLPARGATGLWFFDRRAVEDISIHAPREGSDTTTSPRAMICGISIHAPREGSDACEQAVAPKLRNFNPRSPRGERPTRYGGVATQCTISIHAPREGSDVRWRGSARPRRDFNPRSPRGERLTWNEAVAARNAFQSTLPARGATTPPWRRPSMRCHFNPRSPRGERPLSGRALL